MNVIKITIGVGKRLEDFERLLAIVVDNRSKSKSSQILDNTSILDSHALFLVEQRDHKCHISIFCHISV